MRIKGRQTYAAGPETLWTLLGDPKALERILPGSASVEAMTPEQYQVSLDLRIGQTVQRFSGELTLERAPDQALLFRAEGVGAGNVVSTRGRVALDALEDGGTALSYEAEMTPGDGLPASPRLLQTTARAFARRCLEGLDRQVAMRTRVYTTSVAPLAETPPAPSAEALHRRAILWRALALLAVLVAALYARRAIRRDSAASGEPARVA